MPKRAHEQEQEEQIPLDETVEVDFDFFDIVEDDYLSAKHLVRQLLDADNVVFDISKMAQTLVSTKGGITIKTEGKESDPFALVNVVDLNADGFANLKDYWLERTKDSPELYRRLCKLGRAKVGVVVSERLINMPVEIVPPLYKLLLDELVRLETSYDYLVVPSRAYTEETSELEAPESTTKKRNGSQAQQLYYFHPEDEVLARYGESASFPFANKLDDTSDSRRVFQETGIAPRGFLSVFEFSKLKEVVEVLAREYV